MIVVGGNVLRRKKVGKVTRRGGFDKSDNREIFALRCVAIRYGAMPPIAKQSTRIIKRLRSSTLSVLTLSPGGNPRLR